MKREALIESGLLIPLAAKGMYAFSARFEQVVDGVNHLIDLKVKRYGAERMHFPPGMAVKTFSESGYFLNFPDLTGTVHCYCGDEARHRALAALHQNGGEWRADQQPGDIVLAPAACYPVYSALAARGPLPDGGAFVDAAAHCFRNEPSDDPFPPEVFSDARTGARRGLCECGALPGPLDRTGTRRSLRRWDCALTSRSPTTPSSGTVKSVLMGANQKEQQLKFELVVQSANESGRQPA